MEILQLTKDNMNLIKDNYTNFSNDWNINIFSDEINSTNSKYYVFKEKDIVIGFAGFKQILDSVEIMNIVINRNFRNKGYGTIIFKELIKIIKNYNFKKAFLEVNENNLPAIKIYKQSGFNEISIRKNYYNNSENAIIMEYNF